MAAIDLNAKFTAPDGSDNDSRKTMLYETDAGETYAVRISEATGELFGFDDYDGTAPTYSGLYTRLEMRKIHARSADGKISQSFPVGKVSEPIWTEGGTITVPRKGKAAGVVLTVTGSTGERKTFASAGDTGQSGGDVT